VGFKLDSHSRSSRTNRISARSTNHRLQDFSASSQLWELNNPLKLVVCLVNNRTRLVPDFSVRHKLLRLCKAKQLGYLEDNKHLKFKSIYLAAVFSENPQHLLQAADCLASSSSLRLKLVCLVRHHKYNSKRNLGCLAVRNSLSSQAQDFSHRSREVRYNNQDLQHRKLHRPPEDCSVKNRHSQEVYLGSQASLQAKFLNSKLSLLLQEVYLDKPQLNHRPDCLERKRQLNQVDYLEE
jgi:hypothetical protein